KAFRPKSRCGANGRDDGRGRRIERTSVTAEWKRFSENGHVGRFAGLPGDWRADADGMKAGQVAKDSGELLSSANQRALASLAKHESTAIGALLTKSALRR